MQRQSPVLAVMRAPSIISMALFVILQFLVVAAAFLAGYLVNEWMPGRLGKGNFALLSEAYHLLDQNADFELPSIKDLEYGMIRGMLSVVNDPYTVFVEPPQHELETNRLEGKFGGIGVRIERDEESNVYLYPLPDSPALEAGIQDGDRLLAVGDLPITPQISNEELQAAVRGPVGEKVTITIGRSPDFAPIVLTIVRAEVPLPSVTWNLAPDEPRVGLIQINVIASTTPDELIKAVEDLKSQAASRFVIDVRNNGGGLVEAGVDTARLFLKSGVVIEQKYRNKPVVAFKVEKEGPLADLPMVVLVNRGTASAAEIFAGAVQGQGRAPLVGTRTYGKDTIQLVFNLSDGSSLHVTSAHWWVPSLEPKIGGNGLQPDILLPDDASENQLMQAAIETVLK